MARPKKNNADYFSHDAGMRNHRKIKALRNKFGHTGFSFWCMLLEQLTGCDNNRIENTDSEMEMMAGDFGIPDTEIRDILSFCIRLKLVFEENGFIFSKTLNERLAPVYQKRAKAKEFSEKQPRQSGKYVTETTEHTVVSVTETPQSKVKESIVNERKDTPPAVLNIETIRKEFSSSYTQNEKFMRDLKISSAELEKHREEFIKEIDRREKYYDYKTMRDAWDHFDNWLRKKLGLSTPAKKEEQVKVKFL